MIFSLACQTACDGWRNVDYVTEAAKFFSYWTFMPWIIVTYTGLSVIDGILGTEINLSKAPKFNAFGAYAQMPTTKKLGGRFFLVF